MSAVERLSLSLSLSEVGLLATPQNFELVNKLQ